MRRLFLFVLAPVAAAAMAIPASASDLTLDGNSVSVTKFLGSTMEVSVTGSPGSPASVLIDLTPGPTNVLGVTFPIGFSPAWTIIPIGTIPAGGTLTVNASVPSDPAFDGLTVYSGAVVFDPGATSGLDASNGVSIDLVSRDMQLAGNSLGSYPFFEHVAAFNEGDTVELGVEASLHPSIVGQTGDIYVVESKSVSQWLADATLTDVAGGPLTQSFSAGPISGNTFTIDTGTLSGDAGTGLGVGYDVIIDLNQDGLLDDDDLIDGFGDEAGFYVVHDLTQPGPLAVTEILYSGGTNLSQNTYYPTDIASMGELPLLVVSHGNGHNYQWYDHFGNHMASYGYVVMSHFNLTGPGIETASSTTLNNTDYFLGNLDTIEGGVLDGHVDKSQMTWIGHSRGGEGVVRAYDRVFDGTFVPTEYELSDIKLVSSIAPTGFLVIDQATPHSVPYHLWTGAADADVNGCASSNITQTFQLHDRAQQTRMSISLHGFGHADFHANPGSSVASGPCLVGKTDAQPVVLGMLLPLVKHIIEGNVPAKDYLWRQYETFRPIGIPNNNCIVADLQYRQGKTTGTFVIDDFQGAASLGQSSHGGSVTMTVANAAEGAPDDNNGNFTNNAGDPFNGFNYARPGDRSRIMVFEYNGNADLVFNLAAGKQDFTGFKFLSFRAAQATRHPFTTAELADTTFDVVLTDGASTSSRIKIDAYGGGIQDPYQRTGCGSGAAGWHNEFETVRIRLTDFLNDGSGLDLSDIASVSFEFGPASGSPSGRLGIDDLELSKN